MKGPALASVIANCFLLTRPAIPCLNQEWKAEMANAGYRFLRADVGTGELELQGEAAAEKQAGGLGCAVTSAFVRFGSWTGRQDCGCH